MDVRWLHRVALPLLHVVRSIDSFVTIQSIENASDAVLEAESRRNILSAIDRLNSAASEGAALDEGSSQGSPSFRWRSHSSDSVRSPAVGTGFSHKVSASLP